jgi:hypothetical protein
VFASGGPARRPALPAPPPLRRRSCSALRAPSAPPAG